MDFRFMDCCCFGRNNPHNDWNTMKHNESPGSPVCPGDPNCRRHWAGRYDPGAGHSTVLAGSHWVDRYQATSSCDYWWSIGQVTLSCDHSKA